MISEGLLFLLFPSFSRHGHPCRDLCLLVSEAKPNPVGYQNKGITRLLSNQICTFEKIGSDGTKLSEFRPVDENGDPLADEITVQFYSDRGKLLESYTWTLGENIDEGYEDGWYDENQDEVKDKDIEAGQGFCIDTSYTGAFLKFPAIGSK